jgi:hypothetical protein
VLIVFDEQRLHAAPPQTPIYSVRTFRGWQPITTSILTQQLRNTLTSMLIDLGVTPTDISIRSLCASSAMALLCANVDPDTIRLFGRWRSNEMLHYLHVQALPIAAPLA